MGGVLVSIGAHHFARTTALRLPLYAAGAFGILMAIFAMPHLTTAKIEAARTAGK